MSKCLNLNCKNEAQPGTSTCKECLGIMVGQSASMLGRLGGKATKKKYGKAHYQKLAANMNKKRWSNPKAVGNEKHGVYHFGSFWQIYWHDRFQTAFENQKDAEECFARSVKDSNL